MTKKSSVRAQRMQAHAAHMATVHHVEGPGLDAEPVEHVRDVRLATADVEEDKNRPTRNTNP